MDLGRRPGRADTYELELPARKQELGLGPSFVVLHLAHGDPWVYGVLVNNIWSVTSNKTGGSYSNGLMQPFLNYNFEGGLYLTSAPILTVEWKAESGNRWTVPLGGGVGKIFTSESCR
jgi:hypothetical protein